MCCTFEARARSTIPSFPTNTNYDGRTVFGIKWEPGFNDVRLIVSTEEDHVRDVDLTVKLTESGILIADVQQNTKISGVEFTPQDMPDSEITPNGSDGSKSTLSIRDMFDMNKDKALVTYGNQFQMFCPRLPKATELRLAIATASTIPKALRVFGTCEVAGGDGIKVIKVDQIVKLAFP